VGLVGQDWFHRLIVDGGGTRTCLLAQYVTNCLLKNGTNGLLPSCPGQVIAHYVTTVNMSVVGLTGNVVNGDFKNCIVFNCGQSFVNTNGDMCERNFSSDGTAPGSNSIGNAPLSVIGFVNFAGGNCLLSPSSRAFTEGLPAWPTDLLGNRRQKVTLAPRDYAGCHDPFALPAFNTGASQIRSI
jgi:hypothetical protein